MSLYPALRRSLDNRTLHGNSFFLMVAQGLVMVFGYVFWIIAAHLYSAGAVGYAGTLLSASTLVAQISILGLNNAIVRFLPGSTRPNDKINTSLWLITATSLLTAGGYLLALPAFSEKLAFIQHDWRLAGLLVITMVLTTLNIFTDCVFLVKHATKYNVVIYGLYSIVRLALPFLLSGYGLLGIIAAHAAGLAVAVALSFWYMMRKLEWRPAFSFSKDIIKQVGGYSAASYVAGFLWMAPLLIAPGLIIDAAGAAQAAYFYMVLTIVNCLLIIPTATSQSLFAAGSHQLQGSLRPLIHSSLRTTLSLVIAGVAGLWLVGSLVIRIFGAAYANGGSGLLDLLAATTVIVALNMIGNSILKIQRRNARLISINLAGALVTVAAFRLLLPRQGILGIGYGYLAGQLLMAALFAGAFGLDRRQRSLQKKRPHSAAAPSVSAQSFIGS